MTEQEKAALVEWLQKEIALIQSAQDEIPFGLDYDGENTLKVFNIALAALTAEPVAATEKHEISNMHATGLYLRAWPMDRRLNEQEGYTVKLFTTPPAPAIPDGCTWRWNEYDYYWQASCGGTWLFTDGDPVENEVNFCQKCGGRVIIAEDVEE